jgi:hypothetical protein
MSLRKIRKPVSLLQTRSGSWPRRPVVISIVAGCVWTPSSTATSRSRVAIHRKALGWDMLKAPANLALAVPNLAVRLAAAGAQAVGARRVSAYLHSRNLFLDPAVGREIEWLIMTEI